MFRKSYEDVFRGDEKWNGLEVPDGDRYRWGEESTYVKQPPYFEGMAAEPPDGFEEIIGARALALLGDSVTTDHISPAGRDQEGLAGGQLPDRARRGAARLQLLRLTPREPRGDDARHVRQRAAAQPARARHRGRPDHARTARRPSSSTPRWPTRRRACPSACWRARSTAPAPRATGPPRGRGCWACASCSPRATSASTARTSSGMGVLPLQFPDGESGASLGLTGFETFDLAPLEEGATELKVTATPGGGDAQSSSTPACGSTRPTSGSTTATAASCTSCSGSCSRAPDSQSAQRQRQQE